MQIQDYLSRLLQHAGIEDTQIEVNETEDSLDIQLNVDEQDVGMLIGYHGETLASFQRILRIVYKDEIDKRISLNINDYKEKREEKLRSLAENYARKALETDENQVLPYLPANERFIVHSVIGDNPDFDQLVTESDGEGRNRRLVIKLK